LTIFCSTGFTTATIAIAATANPIKRVGVKLYCYAFWAAIAVVRWNVSTIITKTIAYPIGIDSIFKASSHAVFGITCLATTAITWVAGT
jgi:hypothetical protein